MTLYWKNAAADGLWSNVLNWFTDADATIQADVVPWIDDGASGVTNGADALTLATGETGAPSIDANIDPNLTGITGTCDIGGLTLPDFITINSGTFTGDGFTNSTFGTIQGGTFSGAGFTNSGAISAGTFSGDGFTTSVDIHGGLFTGAGFTITGGTITGGKFTGASLTNSGGTITGGTFTGASLTNSGGTITGGTFTGASLTNSGGIFGGVFTGAGLDNSFGTVTGFTNLSGTGGLGAWFYRSGSLKIVGGLTIKCQFSLASGTIPFDPNNGIYLVDLTSDVLNSGMI